jgi:hypothetical protein
MSRTSAAPRQPADEHHFSPRSASRPAGWMPWWLPMWVPIATVGGVGAIAAILYVLISMQIEL